MQKKESRWCKGWVWCLLVGVFTIVFALAVGEKKEGEFQDLMVRINELTEIAVVQKLEDYGAKEVLVERISNDLRKAIANSEDYENYFGAMDGGEIEREMVIQELGLKELNPEIYKSYTSDLFALWRIDNFLVVTEGAMAGAVIYDGSNTPIMLKGGRKYKYFNAELVTQVINGGDLKVKR